MSSVVYRLGLLGLCTGLLLCGCTSDDGDDMGESQASAESSTGTADPMSPTSAGTSGGAEEGAGSSGGDVTTGDPDASGTQGADESSSGADESGSESGDEVEFDEEFVWVADFLRTNCVACHADGTNGNLLLPSADIGNDEVRLALEDVVATTGLLLVEPFDRNASQTYLQITNEFGAQFPEEQTDRFGAWIDAGAQYFAR